MNLNFIKNAVFLAFFTLTQLPADDITLKSIIEKNTLMQLGIAQSSSIDGVVSLDGNSKLYYKELFHNWEASIKKAPAVMTTNESLQEAHAALRYLTGTTDEISVTTNVPPGFVYWPNAGIKNSVILTRQIDLKLAWLDVYLKDGKIDNSPQLFSVARSILTDIGNADIGKFITEAHFAKIVKIYSELAATQSQSSRELISRILITYPIATQIARGTYRNYISSLMVKSVAGAEKAKNHDSDNMDLLAVNLFLLKRIKGDQLQGNTDYNKINEELLILSEEFGIK